MASKKSQNISSTQYSCWPKSISNNEALVEVTIPSQRSYISLNSNRSLPYPSSSLSRATTSQCMNSVYSESSESFIDYYKTQTYSSYDPNISCFPKQEDIHHITSGYSQSSKQSRSKNQKRRLSPDIIQPYHIPSHKIYRNIDDEECQTNMESSPSTSAENSSLRERRPRKQPHELLSESQKKANHIASEQKRRQNIRLGFEKLIDIVPSLNHGNRSEGLILQKSVDHIKYLISTKNELKNLVRDLETTLGESKPDEDSSDDEHIFTY